MDNLDCLCCDDIGIRMRCRIHWPRVNSDKVMEQAIADSIMDKARIPDDPCDDPPHCHRSVCRLTGACHNQQSSMSSFVAEKLTSNTVGNCNETPEKEGFCHNVGLPEQDACEAYHESQGETPDMKPYHWHANRYSTPQASPGTMEACEVCNEQYDPNQYKPDAGENPLSVLSDTDARNMAASFLNLLERTGEC